MFRVVASVVAAGLIIALVVVGCSPAAQAPASPSPEVVASSIAPSVGPPASPMETAPPSPSQSAAAEVTAMPDAPPSGVTIKLIAKLAKWDLTSIDAPAGKTWQVQVENQDPRTEHNFVVQIGPGVAPRLFSSSRVAGGKTETFDLPGLPAGTYVFRCTLHETMTGSLTVK